MFSSNDFLKNGYVMDIYTNSAGKIWDRKIWSQQIKLKKVISCPM